MYFSNPKLTKKLPDFGHINKSNTRFFGRGNVVVFLVVAVFLGAGFLFLKSYKNDLSVLGTYDGYVNNQAKSRDMLYYETLVNRYEPEAYWIREESFDAINAPEIVAESAMLVDMGTGEVIYEKDPNKPREIASLVKIMTAVVALEHSEIDRVITVSREASKIGENTMGLTAGEKYTLEELLYGLMLASGNDAAHAISEGVAGDLETFVRWMNIKALELGMDDTIFVDSCGLNDKTISTAKDLIMLSKYAMKYPEFRKIVKTYEIELISDTHKYVYLWNQTNLLKTYPGVEGIKTGYTQEAGLCLATYAMNNKTELLGVVLDSNDRKGDMILLLDYGFSKLGIPVDHQLLF